MDKHLDQLQPTSAENDNTLNLRQRAEQKALRLGSGQYQNLTAEELEKTLYELRVRQFELEMQNAELQQLHMAMDTSRARYFDLYNLAPVGYLAINELGSIQETNLTAASLLGRSKDEMLQQPLIRFIHTDDHESYLRHCEALFIKGEPQVCEIRMLHQDGSSFWMRLEATFVHDDKSGLPVCHAVMSNIHNRKIAEEALKESEARFRTLAALAPVGIYLTDADGKLVYVNQRNCEMSGFESSQVMGNGWIQAMHPEDCEKIISAWETTVASRGNWELEYRFQTPQGDVTWVKSVATPETNQQGNISGYIGVNMDITASKKLEQALEKALQEKNILFKELQHRVKNTLILITSLAELEIDQTKEPATREALEIFTDRIRTLSYLYGMLYSGGEAQEIRLDEYFDEVACALVSAFIEQNGSVELILELDEITVDAHSASSLGLILNELITNALKHGYKDQRKGSIQVRCKHEDHQLILEVANDGGELPPDFDIKHSASFGLNLVEMLAHQLAGELEYESRPITRFIVTFPDRWLKKHTS